MSEFQKPYPEFANQVLFGSGLNGAPAVFSQLYPAGYGTPSGVSGSPSQIANASGSPAFRYKWLMYGEGQDENGQPAILNLYAQGQSDDSWFTTADRAKALEQIEVLQEALAYSPLDRDLQSALLDIYYDLAVVDMLLAQKRRVKLASIRLGLESGTNAFIIDDEIDLYREMLALTGGVLDTYGDLLSFEMEGFEPGDVDSAAGGAPFGYWLFHREVPRRNQVPTQYATSSGGAVEDVITPDADNTFSGYKDFRTLLTVLGQDIQFRAELARLLGMRKANGDMTEARELLSLAQGGRASDYQILLNMFPGVDFDAPALDATGVRGALTLVGNAFNEAVSVRGFLNGTTNVVGLDPNFLVLLPPDQQGGKFDTFDILVDKLPEVNGSVAVGPLAIALDAMGDPNNPLTGGGAVQAYSTFRGSVDRVSTELVGLETDFAIRLEDITGYIPAQFPANWDGTPRPDTASELATVERTINSLQTQNVTLGQITLQLLDDISKANEAVSIADNIDNTITGAQATYLGQTSAAWTEIHMWAGLAAGSQAAAEGVYAVAGLDGVSTFFSGGGNAVAAGVAAAANTGVQTAAATRTSMREQELDEAAIGFETTLALAEAPLTVKQAELEVGALMREAYANRLEIEENFTALAQAVADKAARLREVQRLQELLDASRSALAEKFYADPIHFIRAERAILQADAEFRRAQRWVFFTGRALEYKWQERFSYADATIGETYDIGRIFSARNAEELETLLQKMVQFNGDREASPGTLVEDRVIISLRDHVLTPNPQDVNLLFNPLPADDGMRFDPLTGQVVDKVARFRAILESFKTDPGNPNSAIEIVFDTTKLQNLGGSFFAGPDYSNPTNPSSGLYRDKIDWLAVNIVAEDGPALPSLNGRSGSLRYAGNTFFRTRVPPCWTRAPGNVAGGDAFDPEKDFPGEFIISPFRYYQDTNFTGIFDLFDFQEATATKMAYSGVSANDDTAVENRVIAENNGFLRRDFKERSVAATRWTLRINPGQVDISQLEDIELIINHKTYTRPQITCPAP